MFKIGFLPISIWDILDILIVGYLAYQIYKLLKGSLAFNIFIGVLIFYIVYGLVGMLNMELLRGILGQFVSVGFIIIIIIFQQEVRRFLLILGNSTIRQRSHFWDRLLKQQDDEGKIVKKEKQAQEIHGAMIRLSKSKTGALIVLAKDTNMHGLTNSGITLNASIKRLLLESIFNKESPLHDGAVVIENNKIRSASCVLPVSDNENLPKSAGLRHRAAVGVTEKANVAAFIVSEETGMISFAFEGELHRKLSEQKLLKLLKEHL